MTYAPTPTAQPVTTYIRSDVDVIAAVTATLIENIDTKNYHRAQTDFELLRSIVEARGRQGKDIRYVARELGELARVARRKGDDDIAKVARRKDYDDIARVAYKYLDQLPKPADIRQERHIGDLEEMVA